MQLLGAVQVPCPPQAGEHIGVLHVAPVHPVLQVQRPDVQLAFVPQLAPSLLAGFEQTPVEVLQVPTSWHESKAEQTTELLPVQLPLWHVSV